MWHIFNRDHGKKKKSVSQSCRPHLFFCAHLILQNSDFHIFFLEIIIFFHFYYEKRRKFAVLEEFKHVTWELKNV